MDNKIKINNLIEIPKISGIYKIENSNGKSYIGSSKDIRCRIRRHLYDLKNNKHHSIFLQRDWNKIGESYFYVSIIKEVKDYENVLKYEQKYIDEESINKKLYNICKIAGNCLGIKQSEETKMKRALKLIGTKRTPQQCLNISISKKGITTSPKGLFRIIQISKERKFILSKKQAKKIINRHKNGERWQDISLEFKISDKILRREIKKFANESDLLPIKNRDCGKKGEFHSMSKLTECQAREIIDGNERTSILAKKFNITESHISDIKYGRSWKHLHKK